MAEFVSIIVAVIALVGSVLATVFAGVFTWRTKRSSELNQWRRERNLELRKYCQPLLISAFELQWRLAALLGYELSEHWPEQDLRVFTVYLAARFLAWVHIFRIKFHLVSFMVVDDEAAFIGKLNIPRGRRRHLKELMNTLFKIQEFVDARFEPHARAPSYYVPSERNAASELMIRWPGDEDGIADGLNIKGWVEFSKEYAQHFAAPMDWFISLVDAVMDQRRRNEIGRGRLANFQHWLCELLDLFKGEYLWHSELPEFWNYTRSQGAEGCECSQCIGLNDRTAAGQMGPPPSSGVGVPEPEMV